MTTAPRSTMTSAAASRSESPLARHTPASTWHVYSMRDHIQVYMLYMNIIGEVRGLFAHFALIRKVRIISAFFLPACSKIVTWTYQLLTRRAGFGIVPTADRSSV